MKRISKLNSDPPEGRPSRFGPTTNLGALYDRNGPIPVPEAIEKDTDSAWALFEDTTLGEADFEATRHEDDYAPTRAAPLKP